MPNPSTIAWADGDTIKRLEAELEAALKAISGESVSWPQPHPELLTKCAAAYTTMREFGAEIAKLKAENASLLAVIREKNEIIERYIRSL